MHTSTSSQTSLQSSWEFLQSELSSAPVLFSLHQALFSVLRLRLSSSSLFALRSTELAPHSTQVGPSPTTLDGDL